MNRLLGTNLSGIKVTRQLQDGETVTVGDKTFRVYAVPGHTPGSAAYLVNGVLFMGDAADTSSDGRVLRSAWVFSKSQEEDQASLIGLSRRLTQENADVGAIVFAHSVSSAKASRRLRNSLRGTGRRESANVCHK